MNYDEWVKKNPPETWVKFLKDRGTRHCDLCRSDKVKVAKVFIPPDDRQPRKGEKLFALYGLCSDCARNPESVKTVEKRLLDELPNPNRVISAATGLPADIIDKVFVIPPGTGSVALNMNTGAIERVTDSSDSYYIVTGPGQETMYLHPHEEHGYTLNPERFGAAVFRLDKAKELIEELKKNGVCMRKGKEVKPDWNLEIQHVLAHKDMN